jgi:hypothetical protein
MPIKSGLGFLPIFHDFKTYEGLRLIASQRKQRMQTIIIEALQKRYSDVTKKELTINNASVLHSELLERIKAGGAFGNIKTVPEYIDSACKEYVKSYFHNFTV